MKFLQNILNKFTPIDPEAKSIVLVWTVSLTTLVYLLFIPRMVIIFNKPKFLELAILFFVLNLFSLVILKKWKSYIYAAVLCSISNFVLMVLILTQTGGLRAPGLDWIMLSIPITGLLFNWIVATGAGVLSVLLLFVFYYFDSSIEFPEYFMDYDSYSLGYIVNSTVLIFFAWAVYMLYSFFFSKYKIQNKQKVEQIDDLLKVILHDLATPLNVLTLACEKLRQEPTDVDKLEKINKSLNSMNEIIEKVKNMRQMESGTIEAEFKDVCLDEQILFCKTLFGELALGKNIVLISDLKLGFCKVRTDPNLFKFEIMNNILSNALKFSEPGSKIVIKSFVDPDNHCPTVQVIDEGPGIDPETYKAITSHTKVVSRKGSAGEQGQGFGFEIIKGFSRLLDVQLKIVSPHCNGQGTLVELVFD